MKVSEVMTKAPAYCSADTSLGAAAEIMWNHNCGILPVVSPQQSVVGVITDRDMCMAMATRNRLPGQVTVQEVSSVVIYSCQPDDDVPGSDGNDGRQEGSPLTSHQCRGKARGNSFFRRCHSAR